MRVAHHYLVVRGSQCLGWTDSVKGQTTMASKQVPKGKLEKLLEHDDLAELDRLIVTITYLFGQKAIPDIVIGMSIMLEYPEWGRLAHSILAGPIGNPPSLDVLVELAPLSARGE